MEKTYISNNGAWEASMIHAERERQRAIEAQQAKEAQET